MHAGQSCSELDFRGGCQWQPIQSYWCYSGESGAGCGGAGGELNPTFASGRDAFTAPYIRAGCPDLLTQSGVQVIPNVGRPLGPKLPPLARTVGQLGVVGCDQAYDSNAQPECKGQNESECCHFATPRLCALSERRVSSGLAVSMPETVKPIERAPRDRSLAGSACRDLGGLHTV